MPFPCDTSLGVLAEEVFSRLDACCVDPLTGSLKGSSWMDDLREVIGHLKLTELPLLGTHDSATYTVGPGSDLSGELPGIVVAAVAWPWARTQRLSVFDQLSLGVRYLDIRLMPRKIESSWEMWVVHGLFALPHSQILSEIGMFLDSNPNEMILLDYQRILSPGGSRALLSAEQVWAYVNELRVSGIFDRILPIDSGFNVTTASLRDVWSNPRGKRIFAFIPDHFQDFMNQLSLSAMLPSRGLYLDSQWHNASTCHAAKCGMLAAAGARIAERMQEMIALRMSTLCDYRAGASEPDVVCFCLRSPRGTYLAIDHSSVSESLIPIASSWFHLDRYDDESVALRSEGGLYLGMRGGSFLLSDHVGRDSKFIFEFIAGDCVTGGSFRWRSTCMNCEIVTAHQNGITYPLCVPYGEGDIFSLRRRDAPKEDIAVVLKTTAGAVLTFEPHEVSQPLSGACIEKESILFIEAVPTEQPTFPVFGVNGLESLLPYLMALRTFDGKYLCLDATGFCSFTELVTEDNIFRVEIDGNPGHQPVVLLASRETNRYLRAPDGSVTFLVERISNPFPVDQSSRQAVSPYSRIFTHLNTCLILSNFAEDGLVLRHGSGVWDPGSMLRLKSIRGPHGEGFAIMAHGDLVFPYLSLSESGGWGFVAIAREGETFCFVPNPNDGTISIYNPHRSQFLVAGVDGLISTSRLPGTGFRVEAVFPPSDIDLSSSDAYVKDSPSRVYVTGAVLTPDAETILAETVRNPLAFFGIGPNIRGILGCAQEMNPLALSRFIGVCTPFSSERWNLLMSAVNRVVSPGIHSADCSYCVSIRRLCMQLARAHWGAMCCCRVPETWASRRDSPVDSSHDYRQWWWAGATGRRCLWCTTNADRNVLQMDFIDIGGSVLSKSLAASIATALTR